MSTDIPALADSLRIDGPDDGQTVVLAHGAGAPMDNPFMTHFASGLAAAGHRVVRFEFPYMRLRRATGKKKPPDRAPVLMATWKEVIDLLGGPEKLIIGGKSMGGRLASMIASALETQGNPPLGLACLGYPFHAAGRPEKIRTEHFRDLCVPSLLLQGSRDTLGSRAVVSDLELPLSVAIHWLEDGDHDFKPRVASGRTLRENWDEALRRLVRFVEDRKLERPGA
ncbi:MAG: alpha/beta fold hydrolase [Magnetospiraceae bacterium]